MEELENDYLKHLTDMWEIEAQNLTWTKKWNQVLDTSQYPFTKWFVGGELNVCYNALDRHVLSGNGDKVAIIFDSPVTNTIEKLTYKHLLSQVELFAGGLNERFGIGKGDIVFMYVPNVPEGIITMLACCRLGAVCATALGGIGPKALSNRIENVKPKIIVTANATADSQGVHRYKETVDQALKLCIHQVQNCIVVQREHFELAELSEQIDISWEDVIQSSSPFKLCTPVKATDTMFMLYTSGTTGEPKGIVFPAGGFCAGISRYTKYITLESDVIYTGSQLGWILGHMMTVYGTLLGGRSSILYEGDVNTPNLGGVFRVLAEHGVGVAIMNMAHMREIRVKDPHGICVQQYTFPKLQMLLTTGEPIEEETRRWGEKYLGVPVKSFWGQTEFGSSIMKLNSLHEKLPITCIGFPVEGMRFCIVDQDGFELPNGEIGNLMAKYPLHPSAMSTIYKNDQLFVSTYFSKFKNYYDTKDIGKIDLEGRLHILGRNDSIAVVAGKLLPLLTIEEAIRCHPDVAECLVVTTKHYNFGEVPIAFYTLVNGRRMEADNISNKIYSLVHEKLEEESYFHSSYCVVKLPKSPVGKISRSIVIKFVKDHFPMIEDDTTNMSAIFENIIAVKYNSQ